MPEPGHEAVRALDGIAISDLARVEVPAALWRKMRTGELTAPEAAVLADAFAADVVGVGLLDPRYSLIAAREAILAHAARLVARHPLRGYDAVQLASALAVARADSSARFASFDATLNGAAAAEGLALL